MVYGGRVSYCLYLTHALVKDIGLGVIWHDASAAGARAPGVVLLVPALVVVSFLSAAALHHGVEEPARRRRKQHASDTREEDECEHRFLTRLALATRLVSKRREDRPGAEEDGQRPEPPLAVQQSLLRGLSRWRVHGQSG